jgi:hypothetical protein
MAHDMGVRPVALVAAGLALLLAGSVQAQVELSNDGYVDGGLAGFQAGFVTGESAASRFVPPAPTQLLRIRFLFGGGATTDVQTVTVHVWDDAAGTDAPGAELYVNDFAVTPSDEAFQEVDPAARSRSRDRSASASGSTTPVRRPSPGTTTASTTPTATSSTPAASVGHRPAPSA